MGKILTSIGRHPVIVVVLAAAATVLAAWQATQYIRQVVEPARAAARLAEIEQEISAADELFDRKRYQRAMQRYRGVLDTYADELSDERLGYIWYRTGRTHLELALENRAAAKNLDQATQAFAKTITLYPSDTHPVAHAQTLLQQGHLARVRLTLDGDANHLRQASDHYQAALQIFTPETYPLEHARTQRRLGNVYRDLFAKTTDRALIAQTDRAYSKALAVFRDRAQQWEFAETSLEKGIAFYEFGAVFSPLGNGKKAIAALKDALQIYKEGNDQAQFRDTQRHLATAYRLLAVHSKHSSERFHAGLQARRAIYLAEGSSDPVKIDEEERNQRIRTTD